MCRFRLCLYVYDPTARVYCTALISVRQPALISLHFQENPNLPLPQGHFVKGISFHHIDIGIRLYQCSHNLKISIIGCGLEGSLAKLSYSHLRFPVTMCLQPEDDLLRLLLGEPFVQNIELEVY